MLKAVIAVIYLCSLTSLHAATSTWSGAGSDNNWTTAMNWAGGTAPVAGSSLVFPIGAARKSSVNNYPASTSFSSITIEETSYILSGAQISLLQSLTTTYASGGTTINAMLKLGANATVSAMGTGETNYIIVTKLDTNGHVLTFGGRGFIHARSIVGAGSVSQTSTGIVYCEYPNAYSGGTVVSAGQMVFVVTGAAGSGPISITGNGQVVIGTLTTDANPNTGVSFSNAWTLASSRIPAFIAHGTDDVCSGDLHLLAATSIDIRSNRGLTWTGIIDGSGALTMNGGDLSLAHNNTFTGAVVIQSGRITLHADEALGSTAAGTTVEAGAAIALAERTQPGFSGGVMCPEPLTLHGSGPYGLGALQTTYNSHGVNPPITLADSVTIGIYTNNTFPSTALDVERFDGPGSLTKIGLGHLVIRDWSTYAGSTTVAYGVLDLAGSHPTVPHDLHISAGASVICQNEHQLASTSTVTIDPGGRLTPFVEAISMLLGGGTLDVTNRYFTLAIGGTNGNGVFSGTFVGQGVITKEGSGAFTTGSGPEFTGTFVAQGGVFQITGDHHLATARAERGTLTVSGSIATLIGTSGTISPGGSSASTLTCGTLSLSPATTLMMNVDGGIAGYSHDQIAVNNGASLDGAALAFVNPPAFGSHAVFIHAIGSAIPSGTFSTAAPLVYTAGSGHDIQLEDVSINQASSQDDPSFGPDIRFTVHFSSPTVEFSPLGVVLSGTAQPGSCSVSGSGSDYTVTVTGMTTTGTVIAQVRAAAARDGGGRTNSPSISSDNSVTFWQNSYSTIRINFQPAAATPVPGYSVDSGAVFDIRNGLTYGWNAPCETRERNANPDQRLDTLVLMQGAANPTAVWEVAVPNGTYQVHAVCGDPSFFDGRFELRAEGVVAVQGLASTAVPFREGTVSVSVTDGRLTLSSGPNSYNTKIAYIDIVRAGSPPPPLFSSHINFQPAGAPIPAGYAADNGLVFGARTSLTYGWNIAVPVRDRNVISDQRLDTCALSQSSGANAIWEIAVPNGIYDVHVACGDPSYFDGSIRLLIEGTQAISGTLTASAPFREGSVRVTVTDGRLSVTNGSGSYNTKICYIDIQQVPSGNG